MTMNGHTLNRWPAAEKHFRNMAARYVIPAIAYAQQMVTRPGMEPLRVNKVLEVIRQMEAVRKLYTGPLTRRDEAQLAEADKKFRIAMAQLERWEK